MDITDFTATETNAWNCGVISFRFFVAKKYKILPCNVKYLTTAETFIRKTSL